MNAMKQALIAVHRECPDFPVDRTGQGETTIGIRDALRNAEMIVEHPPIPSKTFPCMGQRGEQQHGPDHQRCTKCREIKPFEAFHVNNQTRSGRASWCKVCRAADMKQRRAA